MAFNTSGDSPPSTRSPWINHNGSLPPEIDIEGNIEYKLKLVATTPERFEHLVTQLKWRLSEGHGSAIYEIGVADDGTFIGLAPADMEVSLATLNRMAEFLGADVHLTRQVSVESTRLPSIISTNTPDHDESNHQSTLETNAMTTDPQSPKKTLPASYVAKSSSNATLASLNTSIPPTAPGFLVVEARVTMRLIEEHHFEEIRVALVGGPDGGKSTLLGRLAHGIADNGRGKARLNLLRHRHEISSGRTSSISHEIVGFTSQGEIVNYNTTNISTWQEVCEASTKVVTLLDTCGHSRFLKTTIAGLTGHSPDYGCLVVDSKLGGISEMSKEHLLLSALLGIPTFAVVTKMDVATTDQLRATVTALMKLLKSLGTSFPLPMGLDMSSLQESLAPPAPRKIVPMIVQNEKDLRTAISRFGHVSNSSNPGSPSSSTTTTMTIPIILLSSVTSENVNLLEKLLYLLPKPDLGSSSKNLLDQHHPACYQIEEIYNIPDIGTVVGGFLHSGKVQVQHRLSASTEVTVATGKGGRESQGQFKSTSSLLAASTSTLSHFEAGQISESEVVPTINHDHSLEEPTKATRLFLGPVDSDGTFLPVVVKSIHRQRIFMRSIISGQTATLAIDGPGLDKVKIRKGMVLLESGQDPRGSCCRRFEAIVQVLRIEGSGSGSGSGSNSSTLPTSTIGIGFEGMIHCGSVHQNAKVVSAKRLATTASSVATTTDATTPSSPNLGTTMSRSSSNQNNNLNASSAAGVPTLSLHDQHRPPTPSSMSPRFPMSPQRERRRQSSKTKKAKTITKAGLRSITVDWSLDSSKDDQEVDQKLQSHQSSLVGSSDYGSGQENEDEDEISFEDDEADLDHRLSQARGREIDKNDRAKSDEGTGGDDENEADQDEKDDEEDEEAEEVDDDDDDEEEDEAEHKGSEQEHEVNQDELAESDRAQVVFRFCHGLAYMRVGGTVLFRQGQTKCVGTVVRMI